MEERQQTPVINTDDLILLKEHPLEAGEKFFAVLLLILGVAAFCLSLELWFSISPRRGPRIASAAAVPVFVTGLWSLMALLTVLENFKLTTPLSKLTGAWEKAAAAVRYALPMNVLAMLAAIVAYCAALAAGISFYVATTLFLYGSMCFLTRKHYVKNILWTALVMGFIVLVFRVLFSVVFP